MEKNAADAEGVRKIKIKGIGRTMEIRKLAQSEHKKTRRLYEEVFSEDSASFVDYYYSEKIKDNQIYVGEADGVIVAMIHLNPYRFHVNGQEKQAHYIVAVATKKEFRGRGYMGELLRRCLRDMRNAGESFTYLMPAAEAIYLPYDFRTVYEQELCYYREGEKLQKGVLVEPACVNEAGPLAEAVNTELKKNYQIFAIRDEAYYQRLVKEYESENGMLMVYKKEGAIVACRPKVQEEGNGQPKIMVRILDLERMLMSLDLKCIMAVCFHISDSVIPENSRCIMLTGTEFSGVMLMEGKEENSEGILTIGALTGLIFGEKSVEEIALEEGVSMTERMKEELEKLIPLSAIYINEAV